MQEWVRISLILCFFGFLAEIRPNEPYITEFLDGPFNHRNLTKEQIEQDVYPVGTYSYLALLVVVFLITDFLRYKPLIITTGASGIIVYSTMIWTSSLVALQISQFFYGIYMASEIAYYTYMYAKVDKNHYAKVTSYARAAMLFGKLLASTSAQLLIYFKVMDYKSLNYITLTSQTLAMLWAFVLPGVKNSIYFHREEYEEEVAQRALEEDSQSYSSYSSVSSVEITVSNKPRPSIVKAKYKDESHEDHLHHYQRHKRNPHRVKKAIKALWEHFCSAYTSKHVVLWSIWYAVFTCGDYQVTSYIQVMWEEINPHPSVAWNAASDALLTLFGAIFALVAGYYNAGRFNKYLSFVVLGVVALIEAAAVFMISWTTNLYVSYAGYVVFGGVYGFAVTVTSSEVSRHLVKDSYGLVFGINTLVALLLQTIMTAVVVQDTSLGLTIKDQYTVYAFYYIAFVVIFAIAMIIDWIWERRRQTTNKQ